MITCGECVLELLFFSAQYGEQKTDLTVWMIKVSCVAVSATVYGYLYTAPCLLVVAVLWVAVFLV